MLKYNPKGAMSPKLAATMAKMFRLCEAEGLMAALSITDGKTGEFYIGVDPPWACCSMNRLPGGDISIHFKSKSEDYPSKEKQKETIERTVNGLALLFQCVDTHRNSLAHIMNDLRKVISFTHHGEEFKSHSSEPPDPDKVPSTMEDAINLVFATLDDDKLKWIKETEFSFALPSLKDGFAPRLLESWNLTTPGTPLHMHFRDRFGLFGHPDDITAIIFMGLWMKVRGGNAEEEMMEESGRLRKYWRAQGVNPETGEKGIIFNES